MKPLMRMIGRSRAVIGGSILLLVVSSAAAAAPTRPFGAGERLSFDVYYGPLKAGEARMEVGSLQSVRGRECLPLISTARSGSVVSAFFKVEDRVESWLDTDEMRPLRFEKHLREGGYRCDRVVEFHHDRGVALAGDRTMEISPRTMDALSSLYWVRTLDLEPGRTFWLSSTSERSLYDLRVDVTGRERIETPAGEFDCLVVEPHLCKDGGIFDQRGRMWIWLTDDPIHLPVQMVTQVAIGSIRAVLVDHSLGEMAWGPSAGESAGEGR